MCFNGAATFRSRKGEPPTPAGCLYCPASMGPRPFGRGRRVRMRSGIGVGVASMGPRPFGRGRPSNSTRSASSAAVLQWGRDLSVAEGDCIADLTEGVLSFNGAATFRSRKATSGIVSGVYTDGFNGAATFRSRKGLVAGQEPREGAASMGPRPFGRGRSRRTQAGALGLARFNGAATFRSRKVDNARWGR